MVAKLKPNRAFSVITENSFETRWNKLIALLARKGREMEGQLRGRAASPSQQAKFRALTSLVRYVHSQVKEPAKKEEHRISLSAQAALLRRLDLIAAAMGRITAEDPSLVDVIADEPKAESNPKALKMTGNYVSSWLREVGITTTPPELTAFFRPTEKNVPPPPAPTPVLGRQASPPSLRNLEHSRPFLSPRGRVSPSAKILPEKNFASSQNSLDDWELLGPVFKSFSVGGKPVCKELPEPVQFLERLTPGPLKMMPHQAGLVEAARRGHRSFLLADEPGLGKTAQALLAALATDSFPLLVVVPNVVKTNWAREVNLWLPGRRVTVIHGDGDNLDAFADVFVINYEILDRHLGWMSNFGFRGMVLDEAHFIKNYSSQRSTNVLALAHRIRQRHPNPLMFALTGTPVINAVEDFRAIWHFLGWLTGEKGEQPSATLQAALESSGLTPAEQAFYPATRQVLGELGVVRRRKIEVAKDLPGRRIADLPVELEGSEAKDIAQAETELGDRLLRRYLTLKSTHPDAGEEELCQLAVSLEAREVKTTDRFNVFSLLRRLGASKARLAADFTLQMLGSVNKVVFFAKHVEVMNAVEEFFAAAGITTVSIRGGQSAAARQLAIDRFTSDPEVRLIVCSLSAAGVGINLQAASNVVLAELSWTAAEQGQAIDRVHRIGQEEPVTAWRILGAQTLDVRVAELVDGKAGEAFRALDGGEASEVEHTLQEQTMLSLLRERLAALL